MSKFHDSVREVLEEVYGFLYTCLQKEILSASAIEQKESILSKIRLLQESYPQLQLCFSVAEQQYVERRKYCFPQSPSPSSPPPYVDMKGHSPLLDSPCATDDERYALCESEKSSEVENQMCNESEDNQSCDGYKYTPVPANKMHYFEKYGFLEKKGKERFGGLLTSSLKRWCAINQGLLYYYEKPTDQSQKGVICLEGYEVRPITPKDKKGGFCFELVCPGKRTYQFSAATANEMKEWVSVIERNIKIISESGRERTASNLIMCRKESRESSEIKNFIADSEDIYEIVDEDETKNKNSQIHSSTSQSSNSCSRNASPIQNSNQNEITNSIINYRELYVGLWDCSGEESSELNFNRGDIIRVLSKEYDSSSWWIGELNGKVGFVPKSYLMEAYEMC